MFYLYLLLLLLHFPFPVFLLFLRRNVCRFAMMLWWFSVLICFSFLAASILYGSCILVSSFLMACSVSIISSVQYLSMGFSILCCSPWLSRAVSSFESFILVKLTYCTMSHLLVIP